MTATSFKVDFRTAWVIRSRLAGRPDVFMQSFNSWSKTPTTAIIVREFGDGIDLIRDMRKVVKNPEGFIEVVPLHGALVNQG